MKALDYLRYSQIIFGGLLILCTPIIPHYFFSLDQGGISNYGTENQTIAIFSLAFAIAAAGSLYASAKLPTKTNRRRQLQIIMLSLGVLYALVLLSTFPYKLNETYRTWHERAAQLLFLYMLATALWFHFTTRPDIHRKLAFIGFMVGFGLVVLTLLGSLHVLLTSQLICGITYGYLLVRNVTLSADSTTRP